MIEERWFGARYAACWGHDVWPCFARGDQASEVCGLPRPPVPQARVSPRNPLFYGYATRAIPVLGVYPRARVMASLRRWTTSLTVHPIPKYWYARLVECWAKPGAHFLTPSRLAARLDALSLAQPGVPDPLVEASVWASGAFDVGTIALGDVPDVGAVLGSLFCDVQACFDGNSVECLRRMLQDAYAHGQCGANDGRTAVLSDVLKSHLGAVESHFAMGERLLRADCASMSTDDFCDARQRVLGEYVGAAPIYHTTFFRAHVEVVARTNILGWLRRHRGRRRVLHGTRPAE